MWISRKKYYCLVEGLDDAKSDIASLRSSIEKLSKNIDKLFEESRILREELAKKNDFIENLLSQMISGAVSSISGPKREIKPDSLEPVKPQSQAMKDYLAKKNGEAIRKLPG